MSTLLVTVEFPPNDGNGISSWSWDLPALSSSGEPIQGLTQPIVLLRHLIPTYLPSSSNAGAFLVGSIGGLGSLAVVIVTQDESGLFTWRVAQRLGPAAHKAGCRGGVAAHGSDLTRTHVENWDFTA